MRPRRKTLALAPLCDVAVEADARAHVTVRRTKWDINKTQKQNFAAIGLARYPAASILPLLYSEWVARGAKLDSDWDVGLVGNGWTIQRC